MEASTYQQAIYDFIANGKGHATVEAVAGSGKTTTLVGICSRLDDEVSAIFCAFNKSIADELRSRLPVTVDVKTIHAIGMSALRRAVQPRTQSWVDDHKYRDIIDNVLLKAGYGANFDELQEMQTALASAVQYCQLTLTDPTDPSEFGAMLGRYDIEDKDGLAVLTKTVIDRGINSISDRISFTDMIFMPVALGIAVPKYDFILVDEAQDLSNCQRELIKRLMHAGSRLVAVGDPKQALYGFAGAGTDSFARVQEEFQTTNFPLSVCYRCPKGHLSLAKEIVPQIEWHDAAPEGEIAHIAFDEVYTKVDAKQRDMVLCRTNSPLVEIAFGLIAAGIPAVIKGRDIMGQLTNLAKHVQKIPGATWDDFEPALDEYVNRQVKSLSTKKDTEMKIAALQDRGECLRVIYRRAIALDQRIKTIDGLKKFIDRLYSEDTNGKVTLSSIHKAKGLEANRVFIVGYANMPHPMAKSDWAIEQEHNLRYVALTRAKTSLTFVADKPKEAKS